MPTKKPDPLLSAKEVADQLGLSHRNVLSRLAAGEFPNAINKGSEGRGRHYAIPQSAVDNWLEQRRVAA